MSEIRPLDDPTFSFVPCDSMVIDAIYWFGLQGYEGILTDTWASLTARSQSTLEIGANIGLYSVIGGRSSRGTYSVVEPLPENVEILKANLFRNGIKHVEVLQGAAISERDPRIVRLNIPDEGRGAPVGAHLFDSEVSGRSSLRVIETSGLPIAELARGRDLIKIDAEGVEADLILSIADQIRQQRPTLVVEVLPESQRLASILREMAGGCGYQLQIIPAWGSDEIVTVPASTFLSSTPKSYNSKDIILSVNPIKA